MNPESSIFTLAEQEGKDIMTSRNAREAVRGDGARSPSSPRDFADLIRRWREMRGLSLSAAARAAGITKAHLHDLEKRRSSNPCISTLLGLAKAYDGSVPYMAHLAGTAYEAARATGPASLQPPIVRSGKPKS